MIGGVVAFHELSVEAKNSYKNDGRISRNFLGCAT